LILTNLDSFSIIIIQQIQFVKKNR